MGGFPSIENLMEIEKIWENTVVDSFRVHQVHGVYSIWRGRLLKDERIESGQEIDNDAGKPPVCVWREGEGFDRRHS